MDSRLRGNDRKRRGNDKRAGKPALGVRDDPEYSDIGVKMAILNTNGGESRPLRQHSHHVIAKTRHSSLAGTWQSLLKKTRLLHFVRNDTCSLNI